MEKMNVTASFEGDRQVQLWSMATEPRWSTISKEAKISSCESACAWYLSYGRMALETLGADGGFQRLPGSDKRWGDKRRAVMLPRGPDESRCRYERPTGRFLFSDIAPRSSILDPGGGKGLTTPFSTKRRVRCSDSTSLVSEVMSVHRQAKTRGRQAQGPRTALKPYHGREGRMAVGAAG